MIIIITIRDMQMATTISTKTHLLLSNLIMDISQLSSKPADLRHFCRGDATNFQVIKNKLIIFNLPTPSHVEEFFFNLFIYFWLCCVFVAAHGLSLIAASGGYSSLWCAGLSLWWLLLLWSMGSRHAGFGSCGTWAQ